MCLSEDYGWGGGESIVTPECLAPFCAGATGVGGARDAAANWPTSHVISISSSDTL